MLPNPKPMTHEPIYVENNSISDELNLHHWEMFIITWFQFFTHQNIFYKIIKLFLRSFEWEDLQRSHHREDLQRSHHREDLQRSLL